MMNSAKAADRRNGWILAAALLALTLIFMGRVLFPPEGFALGGLDVRGLFYPWLDQAREAVRSGRLPLWDPNQFAGYPFLANPQVAFFYPPTWLAILLPVRIGLSWIVALHLWLAGGGMLLFVRAISGSWRGAALAAVTYAFSGFMAARIYAGHIGVIATDTWLPWILLATFWAVRRGDVWSGVLAGIPFGLAILAGHTTSLIYVGIAWAAFVTYLAFTTRPRWMALRQAILAGMVGVALSGVQLLPFLQASSLSTRAASPDAGFAAMFSMSPRHLIALALPGFFGEPIRIGYWDTPNFEEFAYYAGILPLLGAVIALRKPRALTWYALALMLLGILMSYGLLAPLFRFERVPARAAFLFTFGISVLFGESISQGERGEGSDRFVLASVGIAALIVLAGVVGTYLTLRAPHPPEVNARLDQQLSSLIAALILIGVGGVLLWRYFAAQGSLLRNVLGISLVGLVVVDLWSFGYKLIRTEFYLPANIWYDARQMIGQTDARVLPWGVSIFEQNGAGQVGLRSVFGYNALEIAAAQAFAASVADPRSTTYDILGVEYVLAGGPLDDYTQGEGALTLVGSTGSAWVYRRSRVFPITRLAYQVEVIDAPADQIARLHAPDFDPAVVLLSSPPPCEVGAAPADAGDAAIVEQTPGRWRIQTRSAAPALLVLGETAYPGWRVTVDGQAAGPLVAYTAVRAVCVPAGTHEIIWTYEPPIYRTGAAISLAALAGIGVAGVAIGRDRGRLHAAAQETERHAQLSYTA